MTKRFPRGIPQPIATLRLHSKSPILGHLLIFGNSESRESRQNRLPQPSSHFKLIFELGREFDKQKLEEEEERPLQTVEPAAVQETTVAYTLLPSEHPTVEPGHKAMVVNGHYPRPAGHGFLGLPTKLTAWVEVYQSQRPPVCGDARRPTCTRQQPYVDLRVSQVHRSLGPLPKVAAPANGARSLNNKF